MTARPKGMAKTYEGRRYRHEQNGKKVEEVVVPVGSYEDTRLGLEALEEDSGWKVVDGDADADHLDADPDETPDETVSGANEASRIDEPVEQPVEQPVDEQLPVEHTTEALGQPDSDHHDTQEGAEN